MVESKPCKAVATFLHKDTSLYTINRIVASCHNNSSFDGAHRKNFYRNARDETLVCEQRQLLMVLEHDINALCNLKGPMTNEETIAFTNAVMNDSLHGFQLLNYSVERQEVVYLIEEVGGFVQISMDELRSSGNVHDMETHANIVSTICKFLTTDCSWNIQGLCQA